MGGGLMQLVAYGAQDVYLTGNPQITFFKVVYRRHTNFSVEAIQQTFQGAAEFGRTVTCNINRNGDLISKMYVVSTLKENTRANWGWVNKLGYAMIESVKIEIGGSKIDEQYGDWLNIYHEIARDTSHDSGIDAMIGNVDAVTKIGDGSSTYGEYTLYTPLQFWFNRNNGLALPLIALQYHDVRVTMKIREAADLINYTGSTKPTVAASEMKDCFLLIDYIYLDSEERKRFAQAAHEYLIEQVQFTGDETYAAKELKMRLNFNHPTKYLAWNYKLDRYTAGTEFVDYAVDGKWDEALDRFAKKIWLASRSSLERGGSSSYSISFGSSTLDIGDQPGTTEANATLVALLAKIDAQILFANATNPASSSTNDMGDATLGNVVILRNDLTIEDMNYTTAEMDALITGSAGSNFILENGVTVKDHFNHSDHMNGVGNPTKTGKLQLNGHDRFSTRDGNYFNYVQPYQHTAVTPADGINVYSFALTPLEHQPSGTCNFSRIDNATLNLSTTYSSTYGSGVVSVYAVNYNVLRVMSGMGGLAYSN
jgi:hypothetical protein